MLELIAALDDPRFCINFDSTEPLPVPVVDAGAPEVAEPEAEAEAEMSMLVRNFTL